jgi:hypothetical protein
VVIVPSITDPFATAQRMEERSQGAITTTTHPYLHRELASATQDIRDYCRWHIAPRLPTTFRRRGRNAGEIWLPAMQIHSIDAVTLDGRTLDPAALAAVDFDPDTGWTSLCGRVAAVTFTSGHDVVPANIETITLELAAAALGTSLGYTREQAGSVSVSFDRAGGGIDEDSPTARRLTAYRIGRLP